MLVRADRSGVFAGYLKDLRGQEVQLLKCRKLWYWSGANAVQEIAVNGVQNPKSCKFTVVVSEQTLTDAIEIIPCTNKAKEIIQAVPEWEFK